MARPYALGTASPACLFHPKTSENNIPKRRLPGKRKADKPVSKAEIAAVPLYVTQAEYAVGEW
jgi:hypothetical protein